MLEEGSPAIELHPFISTREGIVARYPGVTGVRFVPSPQFLPGARLTLAPSRKLWVVLDLDETMIYGRDGSGIQVRPYARKFLALLKTVADVTVWTRSGVLHAFQGVAILNAAEEIISSVIYYDEYSSNWDAGKPLALLPGFAQRSVVLIDDNERCCTRFNRGHALNVPGFTGHRSDKGLLPLIEMLPHLYELHTRGVDASHLFRTLVSAPALSHMFVSAPAPAFSTGFFIGGAPPPDSTVSDDSVKDAVLPTPG